MDDGADITPAVPTVTSTGRRPTGGDGAATTAALEALLRCALQLAGVADGRLSIGRRGGAEYRLQAGTPPPAAFCRGCRCSGAGACVRADTAADPDLADGGPGAPRFLVRQPVRLPDGEPLGELCLTGATPRAEADAARIARGVEDLARVAGQLVADDIARRSVAAPPTPLPPDPLTGLPVRATIRARLVEALRHGPRKRRVAVHILALDRFHEINEDLGHGTGDEILRLVARRLTRRVRASDTVARLGGDEFAVLQLDPDYAEAADALARRLVDMVRAPLTLPEGTVRLQASVGTAVAPEDGDDAESLPANANLAMRRAKAAGGDRAVRFDAGADPARRLRRRRRRALACAIDAEDLEVRYQPQVALATGALVGVEALVRWFPADGGEITPDEFIPLAEESGLVVPLGRCVLRRACAEAAAAPAAGRVAVNLSPVQLARDDIVATVADVLAASGLPADRLELEVTENALHDDVARAVDRLDRLRRLGVSIALDDFGTGFSSLAILWRLPIDTLKLDRAFVRDLAFDPRSVEILTEVVAMARHLRLATVAEGIETPDQRALLTELGCDVGQGFLFGAAAAMPAATAAFTPPPAPPPRAGA